MPSISAEFSAVLSRDIYTLTKTETMTSAIKQLNEFTRRTLSRVLAQDRAI